MNYKKSLTLSNLSGFQIFVALGLISAICVSLLKLPEANAQSSQQIQQLQQQINQLNSDNNQKNHSHGVLSVEASSLSDAVNKLQGSINSSQSRIDQLQNEIASLKQQILDNEAELQKQRDLLGQTIRQMYIEGDISTMEMLATSKDLSEFFDKQQYRESVQSKISLTLDRINKLKVELNQKRNNVQTSLDEQEGIRSELAEQRSEKDRILALNENQQNQLEGQIRANNGKLAELKKKQAEAEAALARALSSGSYKTSPAGPVSASNVVGAIGNTGLSSGAHLHLEVRSGNSRVNPAPYIKHRPVNIPPARISQGYGVANPLYSSGYHTGIDYAASSGTPIFAIDSGQLYRGCSNQMLGTRNNDYGYVAIVEHANGIKSVYAHMSGGPGACNYNTYY